MLGVSCPSSTFCLAVGEAAGKAVAERWNGASWSLVAAPSPSGATWAKLASVSCASSSSCMAVGASSEKAGAEKTLAERWNGTSLSVVSSPNPTEAQGFVNFTDLACAGASSCTAVGYYAAKVEAGVPVVVKTLAESWNGSSWSIKTTVNPNSSKYSALLGVSCPATSACTAVGLAEPGPAGETEVTLAEAWNGSTWSTQSTVNPAPLTEDEFKDVACIRADLCLGVGRNLYSKNSFIEVWNGTGWQLQQNVGGEIKRIACLETIFTPACVAVGKTAAGAPQSWMLNQAEGGWLISEVAPPSPTGGTESILNGVSCSSSACTAVGSYRDSQGVYRPLVERWNGSAWSLQEAPNPGEGTAQNAMLGVSCPSSTFCLAVGEAAGKAVAERWNGSAWSLAPVPLPTGATSGKLASVSCPAVDSCFAAGYSAEKPGAEKPLVESWNGSAWSIVAVPSPADVQGSAPLTSISCLSPRACFAAGSYVAKAESGAPIETKPLVESLTGTKWTVQTAAPATGFKFSGFAGISCTSAIACTAVGAKSTALSGPIMTLVERWE